MKKYTIELLPNKTVHYDCHIDEADDLNEAKKKARFWSKEYDSKEGRIILALYEEFDTGSFDTIDYLED